MRISGWALTILLLSSTAAYADLYQWKDKDGMIHMTDDLGKVPPADRGRVTVLKTAPKSAPEAPAALSPQEETVQPAEEEPAAQPPGEEPAAPSEDLYGDHTLDWWLETFKSKNGEVQSLESSITNKEQFVTVFEGGRRFGQIFGKEEVESYTRYKTELPADKKRLEDLKAEIDELKRKATIAGVPGEIREAR